MKLYCKVKIEGNNGRLFRYTDPVTGMVDYTKKSVRLFNDKSVEVPAAIAHRLLEQDPHLVSKEKFKEPEPKAQILSDLNFDEKAELMRLRSNKFLEFLDGVEGGAENAHENDLAEFARKLEVDLPPLIDKTTKDTWLSILLDAVENYLGKEDEPESEEPEEAEKPKDVKEPVPEPK